MSCTTMEWVCLDGTRMYACEWNANHRADAKAVIGIVHGMGEHTGRYSHVAEKLNAAGYTVMGFDQRGHGRTNGKRGHVHTYEALLEGIDMMIAEAYRKYPDVPFFLYGHSMGGNVTLNYLLKRQPSIAGAIVTGPWLKLAFKPPSLQATIGKVIEKIYPKYTNNRPIVAESLTTDPEMIEKYISDPLGHGQITARFFFSVQRAGKWALEHAEDLTVPLLLMHGGDDKVTSFQASRQFVRSAGPGKSIHWQEWPGLKHELHNESRREEVFTVILEWLEKQIAEQ